MVATLDKSTILIAEDQEHVREALAMLLRGHSYEVLLCASPGEALAAAQQSIPDLAMFDMNYQRDSTSGLEGLELIQRLRALDATVPIIALTAWGNVDLAVSAMKHGASDFIEKPWRNDALLEKVKSLIGRAQELRSSQRVSEYEKQDAQQLQTRIVPQRHLVTQGVELFGDSVPAGVVGGDYFGVWQPAPDMLHFCVADVSGKGTPGALIAAMLYASVSTLSSSSNSPEIVLAQVETTLRNQLGVGHYVTIFYGVLDLRTRLLHYVNAGHCPPILRRQNGSIESLGPTRPVLGFMLDEGFHSERAAPRCRRPPPALHRWRQRSRQRFRRGVRSRKTDGTGSRSAGRIIAAALRADHERCGKALRRQVHRRRNPAADFSQRQILLRGDPACSTDAKQRLD